MPGKRESPYNLTLHAVDVIVVSVLLLISHVHVHEARPPSEHNIVNTRLQQARGLHNTRRLGVNNNNHHGASHILPTHDSTNRDADGSSMILPSSKEENVDRANSDDGSIFTAEGSGDGSVDDHESNDDNEEGDEDDYDDDERGEDIDPGSGNHEPKDVIQSTSSNAYSKNSQTTPTPADDSLSSMEIVTKPTPASTTSNANDQSTKKHEYDLPTTIKPASSSSSKVIPPSTISSIFTSTTEPQRFTKEEWTTRRPWSSVESTKLPDDGSRSTTNLDVESEEEDEDDEDDDDDEAGPDFEDNLNPESESRTDKPVVYTSTSTTETRPTLQTIHTQAPTTTFKPSITTIVLVETTTPIQPISTTAATSTPTATTRPFNTDNIFTHTTTTAPIDDESVFTDTVDDDDDDLDDDDLDDEDDEDDDDDLDDIDSDISNLDPNINQNKDKYSENTVDTKNITSYTNSLDDSTTMTPTDLKLDPSNNRGPPVITDNRVERIDEPHAVQETYYPNFVSRPKIFELRSLPLFAHPVIILLVLGSTVIGLYVAILIVMFIVYRLRRQEET